MDGIENTAYSYSEHGVKSRGGKRALILAAVLLAAAVLPAVFFLRAPALLVNDTPFTALYGASREKWRRLTASLSLFRQVKAVTVADGAGDDVVILAVEAAVKKPYCVLFPRRFAAAAKRYSEQFPGIPVVLLEGRIAGETGNAESAEGDGFFVYRTDRELDLYRAGLLAGLSGGLRGREKNVSSAENQEQTQTETPVQKNIVLFHDKSLLPEEQEAFQRGVGETSPETGVYFAAEPGQIVENDSIICAVIAGGGPGYLDRKTEIPGVLFSWLDPAQVSREVFAVFDDSPWSQAAAAVRLLERKQTAAKIPSKILIFSAKIADNGILRKLRKAARAAGAP